MSQRRLRRIAFAMAIALAAGSAFASTSDVNDDDQQPEPPQVDAFFIHYDPYIQPCADVPLFDVSLAPEVVELIGDPLLSQAKRTVEKKLEEEHWLDIEVDDAQIELFLATANHLRALSAEPFNRALHGQTYGEMTLRSFRWYGMLEKQMAVAQERRAAAADYYSRLGLVFPSLEETLQEKVLTAVDDQMQCLEGERRNKLALIEHYRRKYADRIHSLAEWLEDVEDFVLTDTDPDTLSESATTELRKPDDVAEAAKAALGEAHARRAYMWLNPETSLMIEAVPQVLTGREKHLANAKLHPRMLALYRANSNLRSIGPVPDDAESTAIRMEMMRVRARRARLHLVLRELQLEAAFNRSASLSLTVDEKLKKALSDAEKIKAELEAVNEGLAWYELPAEKINETVAGLGGFAIAFRLSGDLLGCLVNQPLVDGFKDEFIKPIFNPALDLAFGTRVKNSIEKAFDGYWQARKPLEIQQKVLDNLATRHTAAQARAFIAWARNPGSPEASGSIFEMAERSVTALLEDGEFVTKTDGGLAGIFAPLCNDPTDLAALQLMGAAYEQRGNAKAAASRISIGRGMAALPESADLGLEVVEKIVKPVTDPAAVDLSGAYDPSAGVWSNMAYLLAAAPFAATVDRVWNLPTRIQLAVAYATTALPHSQDEYLHTLYNGQGAFTGLQDELRKIGFDYDELERSSTLGRLVHTRLLTSSHEYSEAYRRIRQAFWEREKLWIWARFESDASRSRPDGPPELVPLGRYVMADTVAHEEIELTGLAVASGRLKVRYHALTADYDPAVAQLRELEPLEERYNKIMHVVPWEVDHSDQITALEAQGVRDEAVEVYAGLYRTAVTQTAISLATAGLAQSAMAGMEGTGAIRFLADEAAESGWSVVREQLWRSLNPWAGKFSATGVFETVKDASIEAVRTSVSQIAATQQGFFTEQEIDNALDHAISLGQELAEDLAPRFRTADYDSQADRELYAQRRRAIEELSKELWKAKQDGDADAVARAQAALIDLSGDPEGVAGADATLDGANRMAERINERLLESEMNDRLAGRIPTDPGDPSDIADEVRRTEVLKARGRLLAEGVTEADIVRFLETGDDLELYRRLFTDGFDIQTMRHALTRAAMNDPDRRLELLVASIAMDRHRARIAETLIQRFLDARPEWKGKVGVLRESNRVAVIGDDPSRTGDLDAPGIHVDLEYDLVVRDGAPGDAKTLNEELSAFIASEGYGRPGSEGQRNNLGMRIHCQSEADIRAKGRKSGRRAPTTDLYDRDRLPDRGRDGTDGDIARRLDDPDFVEELKKRGIRPEDARNMEGIADSIGGVLVVRNGNRESMEYMNDPDYMAKPMDCKAKTAKVGPDQGLVVDPTHDVQKKHWDDAIEKAEAESNFEYADKLRKDREKAIETWEKYGAEMQSKYGYTVTDTGRVTKEGFLGIHGDYDLHGVYIPGLDADGNPDASGRLTRANMGDGSVEDNRRRAGAREQANDMLGALKKMFLHGAQDDWNHPGKTADPPVTVFLSKELEQRYGLRSPHFLADAEAMKDFYENVMGVAWEYADGHSDSGPAQGIYKGSLYRSLGGNRWLTNRDATGRTLPDGLQVSPNWVPIPMWQAYGMALDLVPRLTFLIDSRYERNEIERLANTYMRAATLALAMRQADAFLDLVDAWIVSQPEGNRRYNSGRREWLAGTGTAMNATGAAATVDTASVSERERQLLTAEARQMMTRPAASRGSPRARTLIDAGGLKRADGQPGLFEGSDLERLSKLVGILESGAHLDCFDSIGGRTDEGVQQILALLDWMRLKTSEMYADIGLAFVREYDLMLGTGAAVEEIYLPGEAKNIASQIDAAAREFAGLGSAYMRPPFRVADGQSVAMDSVELQEWILSDMDQALQRGLIEVQMTRAHELESWAADWRVLAE
jgi:hypothetical protein